MACRPSGSNIFNSDVNQTKRKQNKDFADGPKWRHKGGEMLSCIDHVLVLFDISVVNVQIDHLVLFVFRVMYVPEHRLPRAVKLAKWRRQSTELSR